MLKYIKVYQSILKYIPGSKSQRNIYNNIYEFKRPVESDKCFNHDTKL